MEKDSEFNISTNEILIRLFLKRLGYEEEVIDKVCQVIR